MAWGAVGRGERAAPASTRSAGSPTSPRGRCARSATRARGSRRTRCGCSGRSASPRRSASTIEPATLAAIARARRSPPTSPASGSRRSSSGSSPRERPSVGLRLLADTGLLAADLAGARRAARHPPEQDPGRGPLGSHARGRSTRAAARPGRPAGRAPPRHRQAGDRGRRPLLRPRDGRRRAGRRAPRPAPRAARGDRAGHPPRPPAHVPLRADRGGDAAVRRFIGKVGPDAIEELFALREADNVGSGVPRDADEPGRAAGAGRGRARGRAGRSTGRRSRSTATT